MRNKDSDSMPLTINFLLPTVTISGGAKSTFELANRLVDRGHGVRVIYPRVPKWMAGPMRDPAMRARKLRHLAREILRGPGPVWFELKAEVLRVPRLSARYVPAADVTVATMWDDAFFLASLPRDRGEKVYFVRGYEVWASEAADVHASYQLPLHRVTTSSWLKQLLEERLGAEVEGVFPNGIDAGTFYRERDDFFPSSPRRVGLLYRNIPLKGMGDGIAALREARERFPDILPVVFGEEPRGEDRAALERMGLLELHGYQPPARMRKIYESLDVFLFPSHHEGFGNPPLEAMACGAACVSTRVGAVPDYAGDAAVLVEPARPGEMAEALVRLLLDEAERQSLARRGMERARLFTWEDTAARLEEYMAGLVAARKAARDGGGRHAG
jgi:glycosyltransferase involved in cell wall biosynthesis